MNAEHLEEIMRRIRRANDARQSVIDLMLAQSIDARRLSLNPMYLMPCLPSPSPTSSGDTPGISSHE